MAMDIGRFAYKAYVERMIEFNPANELLPWEQLGKFEQDTWRNVAVGVLNGQDQNRKISFDMMDEGPMKYLSSEQLVDNLIAEAKLVEQSDSAQAEGYFLDPVSLKQQQMAIDNVALLKKTILERIANKSGPEIDTECDWNN